MNILNVIFFPWLSLLKLIVRVEAQSVEINVLKAMIALMKHDIDGSDMNETMLSISKVYDKAIIACAMSCDSVELKQEFMKQVQNDSN